MEIRRTLSPGPRWLPAGLAALLAIAAVAGFWATRRTLQDNRAHEARTAAQTSASAIAAQLQAQSTLLAVVAQQLGDVSRRPVAQLNAGLQSIDTSASAGPVGIAVASGGSVRLVGTATPTSVPVPLGTDLATRPEWRLALALAGDDGRPRAAASSVSSVSFGSAGSTGAAGVVVLVAMPLYRSQPAPLSVDRRRIDLAGYVVALDSPEQVSGPALGTLGGALAARLTQDDLVVASLRAGTGPPPSSAASSEVDGSGVTWTLAVWPRSSPLLPWTLLGAGVVLAVVMGLAVAASLRGSHRRAGAAVARSEELGLVARTGPLLQQSLDLGDLLPLFVVELSDHLDLDDIAISLVSESGQLVRAFSFGTATVEVPEDPADLPRTIAAVRPGNEVCVPLQRGGRVVGALTARARHGLEPSRLETLQAVSDLLAAALGNAQAFQQEQEMVKRLRDLDRMKTTFLGSVSHELRTSVTAIAGFADLLSSQHGSLDGQQRADFLERISRNAKSLGLLVDDLLDFARLERSAMAVVLQPVDLSDLVPKVIGQMSSILRHHLVSDTLAPGVVALADPTAVERILANLLSNAAKYTPGGTEVHVSLAREGSSAVLSVWDRGPGIPPEERERIFDLFYRVDSPSTRSARGVGIGLALVRQLVGLQRGAITADQTPGGGARFRVELPLAEGHTAAVAPAGQSQAG